MKLTDIVVRSLPAPPSASKVYADDALTGFGVRVTAMGAKAFVLTYGAQRERVTIGRYPVIGLADARTEAKRILAERTLGKLRPKRQTFAEALESFVETRKLKNRPSTAYETERLLRVNFKPLHAMQLHSLRAHHISDITDALSRQGTQSLALHAHVAANTFLRFCAQRHYIPHNPIADMEKPTNNPARDRVLSDDELKAVWTAAETLGGVFGRIVKLLALTGQRRGEIAALEAEWIGDNSITLPASICKNKRPHTFPIGTLTKSIVQRCSFNGFSKAKAELDEKVEELFADAGKKVEPWTLHDLRRTYATNLQRLGIRLEVIEALLNHISGTRAGIVGVYNRHRYEQEMRGAVATYDEWFERTIMRKEDELTLATAQA